MATDLGAIQDAAAQSWGLDPTYFKAIGSVESGNNINSPDSPTGAVGPMQVEPATAAGLGVTDIRDPVQNVFASAKYLSQQLDKYQDPNLAAAAYNAGPGRVDAYLADPTGSPLPDQTLAYVPKVAAAYKQIASPTNDDPFAGSASPAPVQVAEADTGTKSDASPAPSASSSSPADPFSDLTSAAQARAGGTVGSGSSAASPPVPAGASAGEGSGKESGSGDPFSSLMAAASAHASANASGSSAPATVPVVQSPTALAAAPAGGNRSTSTAPAPAGGPSPILPAGIVSSGRPSAAQPLPPQGMWHQGVLGNVVSGAETGIEGVAGGLATLANKADQAVPALQAIDSATGLDPAQAATSIKQDVAANDAAGAGSLAYGAGRFAGTVAGTAPLVETGAGALGLVGDAAATALPGAATAIRAGTNLLTGGGNATGMARYVNAATSGAGKAAAAGIAANGGTDGIGGNAVTGAVLGPAASLAGPYIGSAAKAVARGIAGTTRALAGDAGSDAPALVSVAAPNQLAAPSPVTPVVMPANPLAAPVPIPAGTVTAGESLSPGYRPQATATAAVPASVASVAPATATAASETPSVAPATPTTSAASTGAGVAASSPAPEALRLGIFSSPSDGAKYAQTVYDSYMAGGPTEAVASKIPGVNLTAAQATGNANLALLERTRRAANPQPFVALEQANDAARNTFAQGIVGTPAALDTARADLATTDAQMHPQVFGSQQPVSTQPIMDSLQAAIKDNNGRPTVQGPLQNVADQIQAVTGSDGTASPSDLWNVRKYLGDIVSPRVAGSANDGRAAAAQLMDLKPTIDAQIEQGAPGFGNYLQTYNRMSQPIGSMEYLQSNFPTDAQGNVQLGRLDNFIKTINRGQAKPGINPADAISDQQMQGLTDLRDDLRLKSNIDLGKARGSDTATNVFTNSKVASMMQGATPQVAGLLSGGLGPLAVGSGLEGTGLGAYAGRYVANRLATAQVNRLAAVRGASEQALDNLLLNPGSR